MNLLHVWITLPRGETAALGKVANGSGQSSPDQASGNTCSRSQTDAAMRMLAGISDQRQAA
jgi:hypothetical protein